MHGIGTLINVGAILLGGFVGLFVKKGLNEKLMDSVMKAIGVAVMFVGISGALTGLLKITEGGSIETSGTMLMIISLILGTFVGELMKIEDRLESVGEKLKGAVRAKDSGNFVESFVNTTLIFCVGAMAIIGSLEDPRRKVDTRRYYISHNCLNNGCRCSLFGNSRFPLPRRYHASCRVYLADFKR